MKRRLIKNILMDTIAALGYAQKVYGLEVENLLDELEGYLNNNPLFRVDYALPVLSEEGTLNDEATGKSTETKFRVSRKVFAYSYIMKNWYHGWFALDVKTGEIIFRCCDLNYYGGIVHDFLCWIDTIPAPDIYSKPIKQYYEKKDADKKKDAVEA